MSHNTWKHKDETRHDNERNESVENSRQTVKQWFRLKFFLATALSPLLKCGGRKLKKTRVVVVKAHGICISRGE